MKTSKYKSTYKTDTHSHNNIAYTHKNDKQHNHQNEQNNKNNKI